MKLFLLGIRLKGSLGRYVNPGGCVMLILLLSSLTFSASAQNLTWTDNFIAGQAPTSTQCENWTNFLQQLGNKSFISVTISGTYLDTDITITDPVAATELAGLLNSGTPGSVVSGGHTWRVNKCGPGSCVLNGVELSIDGVSCSCDDRYVIRPYVNHTFWGGLNTATCEGMDEPMRSQTMKVEFSTGVSITANGPTTFCEGASVVLTASSQKCSPPFTYLWSNNETTESITVTQPGDYSVTVSGSGDCTGTSPVTSVTVNTTTVDAGEDVTICNDPIQLYANRDSEPVSPMVNTFCLYDSPGGRDDCTFTGDLCFEGYDILNNSELFSKSGTIPNTITDPIEIRFKLFYSLGSGVSTIRYKLNDNIIGSVIEDVPTGTCSPAPAGPTFAKNEFQQFWSNTDDNILTVEILSDNGEIYVFGLTYEVVSQTEFYSWSPATGLSDDKIQNPVADPEFSTTYAVTYTATNGCSATDQIEVNVTCNNAPVAVCKPVSIELDNNCEANADAIDFNNGSTSEDGGELTYSVFPAGPYPFGTTNVTLTVTDSKGQSSTCATTITVTDTELPAIATLEDVSISNDPGECSATLSLPEPETADNCGVETISHDQTDVFAEGETIVTWTVTDIHGNSNSTTQKVIVTNIDPVIHWVTLSNSVVAINTPVSLTASYDDNNVISATIDWDDLSGPQTVSNPADLFNVSHTYNSAGLYSVTVILTDACGATASYVNDCIVVYDRNGGFVTGGGWFNSPAGAYIQSPNATGKASFNFVSKYKKKGTVPEGNAGFRFKAGKLKFTSNDYQWLVVDGNTAVFKASGKVDEESGYEILLSLVDDDAKKTSNKPKKSDQIRIKISKADGTIVYDTQPGSPDDAVADTKLGGGSIQIHNNKSQHSIASFENPLAHNDREASASVYPNPFMESIELQFYSSSKENLNLQLMDITGKVVYDQRHSFSDDGLYSVILPEGERGRGIYILKINQGRRVEFLRLVRK